MITVRELMDRLATMPPDAVVFLPNPAAAIRPQWSDHVDELGEVTETRAYEIFDMADWSVGEHHEYDGDDLAAVVLRPKASNR